MQRYLIMTMFGLSLLSCAPKQSPDAAATPGTATTAPPPSGTAPGNVALTPQHHFDTSGGTLTVSGSGVATGRWAFENVTAILEEKAQAGSSLGMFSLEAHDPGNHRNFVIRLRRNNAPVEAGSYGFDKSAEKRLEARWENGGGTFSSNGGTPSGNVTLKSLKDGRASGTFDITLPAAEADGRTETLKGSFDQKYQSF